MSHVAQSFELTKRESSCDIMDGGAVAAHQYPVSHRKYEAPPTLRSASDRCLQHHVCHHRNSLCTGEAQIRWELEWVRFVLAVGAFQ